MKKPGRPKKTKEELKKWRSNYYQLHKAELIEKSRIYLRKNKEKVKKNAKKYYEEHKDEFVKRKIKYKEAEDNSPKMFREYIRQLIQEYEDKMKKNNKENETENSRCIERFNNL